MDADGGGAGGGGRGTTSSGPSSASPFIRGQASAQVRLPAEVEVEVAETCLTLAAVGIIASARPLGQVGSDRGGVYGGDVRVYQVGKEPYGIPYGILQDLQAGIRILKPSLDSTCSHLLRLPSAAA
ncbi:hypothetical protein Vretifemale_20708, partial [Volvox reticuliferus]